MTLVRGDKITKETLTPVQYDYLRDVALDFSEGYPQICSWMAGVRAGKGVATAFGVAMVSKMLHHQGIGNGQWLLAGQLASSWQENNEHYFMDAWESLGEDCVYRGGSKRPYYQVGNWGKFYLFGGGNKRSFNPVRGLSLCGAWIDEVTLIDRTFFQTVLERRVIEEFKIFCTTNAGRPNDWFFKDYLFSDKHGWRMVDFRSMVEQNTHLPLDVIRGLRAQNPNTANYKRMVLNMIVADEGAVYQLDMEHIEDADYPRVNSVWCVDPGTGSVTAAVELIPTDYGWLVNNEYYHDLREDRGMSEMNHARAIVEKFDRGDRYQRIIVDPAGDSMRRAFYDLGFRMPEYPNTANERDWDKGVQLVNNLLWASKLKVHERCTNYQAEAAGHIWDEYENLPVKSPDHLLDCVRYGCVKLFPFDLARVIG